ncbi:hypothetical protein F5876DRAFT_67533 [Lentinula aff. lateritia]|uniref:Uncharacterized protein n=1 Tax=Lentinula aff. lateritia TaxID=2804960 RepID=A0ACC1TTN6_9AGAR|nr:hypothetical protein F5876DRAFT_67533 [Lentinula aff. lateritia]
MRSVVTTLLVLHLFTTLLGHAMPTKKGDSTAAGMQLQQPSHWVNSYKSCNTEKTETIHNWILDVFTMTSEAESMTRDHPAFERYFFREDFPTFKDMVQSLNSRSSEALKFNVQCADYGQKPCPPNQWITIDRSPSSIYTIYVCPNTFNFKVTLASKPFDNSENGWCRPPHLLKDYVPQARALLSRMIRIRFQMKGIVTKDYNENDVTLLTAAGHLKSKYTTLLAQWEQTHLRQQGSPPVRPSLNPESYVASIVEFFFTRKCGKDFDPEKIIRSSTEMRSAIENDEKDHAVRPTGKTMRVTSRQSIVWFYFPPSYSLHYNISFVGPLMFMGITMRVITILLVLQISVILGHAFPMPGISKGKKGRPPTQSSSSTPAQQRNAGSQTSVPSFPPSHWVKPYQKCNTEKTKTIDNWIMDAFNMTFEAEHITRDHPARRGLGTDQKYIVRCADNGQKQCPPNTWLAVDIPGHAICICSDMFHHETAKVKTILSEGTKY